MNPSTPDQPNIFLCQTTTRGGQPRVEEQHEKCARHTAKWLKYKQEYHTVLAGVQHVIDRDDPSPLGYDIYSAIQKARQWT